MSLIKFTGNQKTILSIDFDRNSTCMQHCPYCYVDNMERIYPAYLRKIERNTEGVRENPELFAEGLNEEYRKARRSKAKSFIGLENISVRVYGSGDFVPKHFEFLKELEFKIFLISKNLVTNKHYKYIDRLLGLPTVTRIMLSFDNQNIGNYDRVKKYLGQDRIGFCFTGLSDDFQEWKDKGYKFDVFYNISGKQAEKEKASLHRESCPCDSGSLPLQKACITCNECWRSSITETANWNDSPMLNV